MTLKRLVLTYTKEGVEIPALYRTPDGPDPCTKARLRKVTGLVRTGLAQAIEAMEGRVEGSGSAGYEVREYTLIASPDPAEANKSREKGA